MEAELKSQEKDISDDIANLNKKVGSISYITCHELVYTSAFSRSTWRSNTTMHNPNFEILWVPNKVSHKITCQCLIVSPCTKATIERSFGKDSDEVFQFTLICRTTTAHWPEWLRNMYMMTACVCILWRLSAYVLAVDTIKRHKISFPFHQSLTVFIAVNEIWRRLDRDSRRTSMSAKSSLASRYYRTAFRNKYIAALALEEGRSGYLPAQRSFNFQL